MDEIKVGDRVIVTRSLLYTGRTGIVKPASNNPDDFWDFNVVLEGSRTEPVRTIGVTLDQLELDV